MELSHSTAYYVSVLYDHLRERILQNAYCESSVPLREARLKIFCRFPRGAALIISLKRRSTLFAKRADMMSSLIHLILACVLHISQCLDSFRLLLDCADIAGSQRMIESPRKQVR
jgi:hypothetical protein